MSRRGEWNGVIDPHRRPKASLGNRSKAAEWRQHPAPAAAHRDASATTSASRVSRAGKSRRSTFVPSGLD